jgi:hypothetical protein
MAAGTPKCALGKLPKVQALAMAETKRHPWVKNRLLQTPQQVMICHFDALKKT